MTVRPARAKKAPPRDPLEADFGPEPEVVAPGETSSSFPQGPFPGRACGGDGCLLKPVGSLLGRFALRLSRGHADSLSRAAFSGIELMKALRDFLDEEIVIAENAAVRTGKVHPRYSKIPVE